MSSPKPLAILHLDAGHDNNGNPRRVYVVFGKNGDVIDTIDEGYEGRGAIKKFSQVPELGTFSTTPSEYKNLLKYGRPWNNPDRTGNPKAKSRGKGYTASNLDEFVDQYLITALWASGTDEDGNPLDREYDASQFTAKVKAQAKKDAKAFLGKRVIGILPAKGEDYYQPTVGELISEYHNDFGQAGHDFWLTRTGSGTGFWDGDWAYDVPGSPQDLGDILTYEVHLQDVKGRPYFDIEGNVYAYRGKLHMG